MAEQEAQFDRHPSLSAVLKPGTRLRYGDDGHIVTLERRKDPLREVRPDVPWHPGWWLADGAGGLADFVIDAEDSPWQVLDV